MSKSEKKEVKISQKTILIGFGIIAVAIIIAAIIFSTGRQTPPASIKCEGIYIEYQGNCCIDANYNNKCDELEKKVATGNGNIYGSCSVGGIQSDVACSGRGSSTYISVWSEMCQFHCQSGNCVAYNCYVADCEQYSDCRDNKQCDLITHKCV